MSWDQPHCPSEETEAAPWRWWSEDLKAQVCTVQAYRQGSRPQTRGQLGDCEPPHPLSGSQCPHLGSRYGVGGWGCPCLSLGPHLAQLGSS